MPLTLSGDGAVGPLSATEVGYLDGVTSSVQTQINSKGTAEVGTWTPVVADAATGGNVASVGTVTAQYAKVGNVVTLHCKLENITTTGMTAGNQIYVRGVPFTPSMLSLGPVTHSRVTLAAVTGYVAHLDPSASNTISFWSSPNSNANEAPMLVSSIQSTAADIYFTITYRAA